MRLTNLIVMTWRYRQELQSQYEAAAPQTVLDHAYLRELADRAPRDKEDGTLDYTIKSKDIDGNKALFRDDEGPMIRQGEMPVGGRRHTGILAWEWLQDRLKKAGIDITEESEFADLDEGYCQKVADLSAELLFDGFDLNERIAADREWIKQIEEMPENELLCEGILDEMGRLFGFCVKKEPEVKLISYAPVEPIPTMVGDARELEVLSPSEWIARKAEENQTIQEER